MGASGRRHLEAVHAIGVAGAEGDPRSSTRFRPTRAGICNVWEFDDQEFVFSDGRLVLRGANTAGKSKALELLVPFVLDGETRPERLDPFGSRAKSMLFNLVGFAPDIRRVAIGYVWLEFERRAPNGDSRFVTAIVGMRATASASEVETWFGVTDQRVGTELDLAPSKRPLTRERFQQALGERGRFFTKASAHREALDEALFGLGPDRYDALIHLLLALRRPKLSEKLDLSALSGILADALEPLSLSRIQNLADAFGRLESQRRAAAELEHQSTEFARFVQAYERYALAVAAEHAHGLLYAEEALSAAREKFHDADRRRHEAEQAVRELDQARTAVVERRDQASVQLEALDLAGISDVAAVQREAGEAAEGQRDAIVRLQECKTDLEEAESALSRLAARRVSLAESIDATLEEARGLHERLGLGLDRRLSRRAAALDAELLREAATEAATVLGEVRTYVGSWLERLHAEERSLVELERELACARSRADLARDRYEHEHVGVLEAERRVRDAQRSYADALYDWTQHAIGLTDGRVLAEQIGMDAQPIAAAQATVAQIGQRLRAGLVEEATYHGAGVEPRGWQELWRLVEFVEDVDEVTRRGLEAALFASRLALVLVPVAAGADQLVATGPGMLRWTGDSVASPSVPLSRWLRPREPNHVVDQLLGSVGAVEGPGTWVSVDGAWSIGALRGVGEPGPSARIGSDDAATSLGERLARLEARLGEFPFPTALVEARAVAHERQQRMAEARAELDRAEGAVHDAQQAVTDARAASEGTRGDRGLGADALGVLDTLERRLQEHGHLAGEMAQQVVEAERRRERARERLEQEEQGVQRAARRAARLTGAAAELARRMGESQCDAVAARERLMGVIAECDSQLSGMAARRDELMVAAVRRQAACDEHRRQLDQLEAEFERCTESFTHLMGTEVITLAEDALAASDVQDENGSGAGGILGLDPVARARRLAGAAGTSDGSLESSRRLHEAYALLCAVAFEHRPQLDTVGGVLVATLGAWGNQGAAAFARDLAARAAAARARLSDAERQAITEHLLHEAADQLRQRLVSARELIARMNAQLRAHPTSAGVWLELAVEPEPWARDAVGLLCRPMAELDAQERDVVEQFLLDRIEEADRHDGANGAARLADALDYRRWHSFPVWRCSPTGRQRLTARSQSEGSGGEQAKLAHQPLFAAAAAYYASARPDAPRLIVLDEAFAGIDDPQRRDLFGMLTALDLDWVVTGYDIWGCFDTVPTVSVYHLERTPGVLGVATLRFVWAANRLSELDGAAPAVEVPGASSVG